MFLIPTKVSGGETHKSWFYFLIFLTINSGLAWLSLTVWQRIWFFPLGLFLEASLAFLAFPIASAGEKIAFESEVFSVPSWVGWAIPLGLGIFLRLFQLVSLPAWPLRDDASYSFFAIRLFETWRGGLFFGPEQTPALFTWLETLFFKFSPPSLESMWLYCALYSILAIPLGYWAARCYFSKSFSFLLSLLLALGFWPVYWGKLCMSFGDLSLLGLLIILIAFKFFWDKFKTKASHHSAIVLGCCIAVSLYISILFLVPAAFFTAAVFVLCLRKPVRDWKTFSCFLIPLLLLSLPMDWGYLRNILEGHIHTYLALGKRDDHWILQLATSLSYLTVFHFGTILQSYHNFGPFWGGLLNPLLGACFFLGAADFLRFRQRHFFKWAALGVFCLLVPGLLSNSVECLRVFPVMPFILVVVAMGIVRLQSNLTAKWKMPFLILMMTLSLALDIYHLWGPYHQWSVNLRSSDTFKSADRWRAFQVLEKTSREKGPGLIFSDFVSDVYDQSLLISTYPFNAARNPNLNPEKARWAAVLIDLHYQQPVLSRFPQAQFYVLSDSSAGNTQVLALAVIPMDIQQGPFIFSQWVSLHKSLQNLFEDMPYHVQNPDFQPVLKQLFSLYPEAERDSLLKAWVLEKALDLLLVGDNVTSAFWFLARPADATRSFPFLDLKFAQVYHRLGLALVKAGDWQQASECFRRASLFDPNYDLKQFMALCHNR
jgi:hypothetical protein